MNWRRNCAAGGVRAQAKGDIEVKFIVEKHLLHDEDLVTAAKLIKKSGADFIKNANRLGRRPADPAADPRAAEAVGPDYGIRAARGAPARLTGRWNSLKPAPPSSAKPRRA